jgi:glycerol-3-phosphate dehydrogenase
MSTSTASVVVIGGGIVGAAMIYTLAHHGVDAVLLEAAEGLAYSASGTNSGALHTGFDSTPGELETELILRAAPLRAKVLEALDVPVMHCGAVVEPKSDDDRATIARLAAGAAANGVQVNLRDDGALEVPGESISDPVAFTEALAASAVAAGARVLLDARVVGIDRRDGGLTVRLADGRAVDCTVAINCGGLYADEIARMVGDDSFEIYPRKGEFFVFELPDGQRLDHIILPVPTKRTKGVLVFPTLDGKVVAGPTAVDVDAKTDWSVRPEAQEEILAKAVAQFPALEGLTPVDSYTGLRPAGRGTNYVIGPSAACANLINVAAIRSTGLTSSLGIAAYVTEMLPELGVEVGPEQDPAPAPPRTQSDGSQPWWQRTAHRYRVSR